MDASEAILEQWVARTAESYPRHTAALLSKEQDPFRNPVSETLRRSLARLLCELLGEMDAMAIDSALDSIIRLQVVQGLASDDAVRFVFLLEPILQELRPERGPAVVDCKIASGRIDRLAALVADKYAQCREQLVRIRANEIERANQVQQRIFARRPA